MVVEEKNDNAELLKEWYQLDTNCIPHAYILQNISSILPDFVSKVGARKEVTVRGTRGKQCVL